MLHVLTEAPAVQSLIFIWLNYGRFVPVACQTRQYLEKRAEAFCVLLVELYASHVLAVIHTRCLWS